MREKCSAHVWANVDAEGRITEIHCVICGVLFDTRHDNREDEFDGKRPPEDDTLN